MTVERFFAVLARAFRLDEAGWRRHANPWSVWTRVATLPALVIVGWSAHWFGWWSALPAVALVGWTYVNPRLFPEPTHFDRWASQVTLGERLWLQRSASVVQSRHRRPVQLLTLLSAAGFPVVVAGVVAQAPGWTFFGLAVAVLGKLWLADRMVWMYSDAQRDEPDARELV